MSRTTRPRPPPLSVSLFTCCVMVSQSVSLFTFRLMFYLLVSMFTCLLILIVTGLNQTKASLSSERQTSQKLWTSMFYVLILFEQISSDNLPISNHLFKLIGVVMFVMFFHTHVRVYLQAYMLMDQRIQNQMFPLFEWDVCCSPRLPAVR